jgi:two-component system, OmpR family, sensor kinase
MRSIERYLLGWIVGAMGLGTLVVALVTYLVILDEMNEIYDADLRNVAEALGSYRPFDPAEAQEPKPHQPSRSDLPADAEIVTLTWTHDGRRVYASDPRVKIPFVHTEALARRVVDGETWIVYTDVSPSGVAQAAQRASARRLTAAESASKVFPPMAGLALLVSALMIFALRRGLRPLDQAARFVAERSASSLAPIAVEPLPREISPLALAINGLLAKLDHALSAQRRFLADAAHELRTPVTALQLQLQWLKRSGDEASRQEALTELESGIARSRRLVEQLLEVARADEPDDAARAARREPVDLGELARSVVGALSVRAEQRGVDLGARTGTAPVVQGDPHQLTVLLNNLVENALRYTPAGGVVDVEATQLDGQPMLRVVDNGPGIPADEREVVFDRFYRGRDAHALARDPGGSGLGLAIVRAIAGHHQARVSLHTPASGMGLEVRVCFTPPPAGPAARA